MIYSLIFIQKYLILPPKSMKEDIDIEQSMSIDPIDMQELEIAYKPITKILSYSLSLNRKKIVITTENGFCIVNNATNKFKKFEDQNNPFYPQKTQGISMGSILEQRPEIAIVPTKNTKKYSSTTVYIFDYTLKTILYSNDFFLPIRQLTLTDDSIIVSNNKRLILYNYEQDTIAKDQKYYLDLYEDTKHNNSIRYLQMFCEQRFENNSIPDNDQNVSEEMDVIDLMQTKKNNANFCKCGKYVINSIKPYKIVYCRVYTINAVKRLSLVIYDWAIDKQYAFDSLEYSEQFDFAISDNGEYLAYTQNEGRAIKIHKIGQQGVHQTFKVSRSIKPSASCGFFRAKGSLWFTVIRKQGTKNGHMHIFKISETKKQQIVESEYKRYFGLYEITFKDYGISDVVIGPDFYVQNESLYSFSLSGVIHNTIDFKRTGNHPKKIVENFQKWDEQQNY